VKVIMPPALQRLVITVEFRKRVPGGKWVSSQQASAFRWHLMWVNKRRRSRVL